ncbi:Chaperone surA [Gossypium australe]|uniref:Chaperone surA n=1 Tax=Gossypium australe TaxID=47621 RepID=A0A5B6UU52_9ROSI|nr:Chaperone surA [Gossypium australe]
MDPNRAVADDVESNALASVHGVAQFELKLLSGSSRGEAKEAFFQMMNEWFTEFFRTNPVAQQPPPPPIPQPVPIAPQGLKSLELQSIMILREPSFGLRIRSRYLMNYLIR